MGAVVEEAKAAEEEGEAQHWYQCPLPKPPLPSVAHTLERYLEYVRVLAHSCPERVDWARTQQCALQFQEGLAEQLQTKLAELAEQHDNWVNLFWLPEMYLRQRLPLPLNFNPAYIFPRQQFSSPADQTDYAAWLVRGLLDFKERVDSKLIARETIADRFAEGKTAQMCMDQYERILNCYREPRKGLDVHQDRRAKGQQSAPLALQNGCTEAESELTREHIVVLCQRQPYVLFTKRQAIALSAPQIAQQLARIRTAAKNRHSDTVHAVGGASVGNRDRAAQFWTEMEKAPANRRSLALVRSAVFVLCLDEGQDEELASLNGDTLTRMEGDGLQLLHGNGPGQNGLNRWFDATIQLVVSSNGCCGLCIEHSVAEGIVIINMAEEALRFAAQNWKRADKQTHKTDAEEEEEAPRPLCWALGETAIQLLGEQIAEFDSLAKDVQLRVLVFTGFGKEAIKGWHVSPDGFVQLVMQLAHFQLHGRLVSTYESATMRRFRLGRVDNIRAATPEALAWTKAMADPDSSNAVRKELFTAAARKQALITRENVTGQGIDNHLCALEVLSRENGGQVPELFREPAWTETMRFPLTTSQVSTSPEFVDCYLCYGPVVPDGYGCAYNVQQHQIIFAVSAWKSDDRTRADDFRRGLGSALAQTREMLERQ